MHPKNFILVRTGPSFNLKITHSKIILSYSLKVACALGSLGRRFESCRPDSYKPFIQEIFPESLFYCLNSQMRKASSRGSSVDIVCAFERPTGKPLKRTY